MTAAHRSATRLRPSTHRRAIKGAIAAVLAISLTPMLSGCWQGFGASTTMQNSMNSGNGTQVKVGALRVENATVVRGDDGAAQLVMSVFNNGAEADDLVGATINGQQVDLTGLASATIEPGGFLTFGYGAEGMAPAGYLVIDPLDVEPGSYTAIALAFAKSGLTEFESVVVPPVGYYEGLAPASTS